MDIKDQIKQVLEQYPKLAYDSASNCLFGELLISQGDTYGVRIELNHYPKLFPSVYETNERIPPTVGRHIYSDSGACFLTTNAKAQILLQTRIKNLVLFIHEIVVPYFQNNSYYEINGRYLTDEYSHGGIGVIEGYRDILGINQDLSIAKLMYHRVLGKKLRIHDQCYCESGSSLKKCHGGKHDQFYRDFKKIQKPLLQHDFMEYFVTHLNLKKNNDNSGN